MENNLPLIAGSALALIAILAGLAIKLFSGRGHELSGSEVIDLKKLKASYAGKPVTRFGTKATLLQFSTEYCGQCPGVRRALTEIAAKTSGVKYIDVDVTDRLDLAAHFRVSQTPTVFVLDPKGAIKFRVSGLPKPGVINFELERLGVN